MPITLNDAATGLIYEIMYCTAISGSNLTVSRGEESTSAQSWNVGDIVFSGPTAGSVAAIDGNPNQSFYGAPAQYENQFVTAGQLQNSSANYAVDTGSPNVYQIALTPAITGLSDGLEVRFKAANPNNGPSSLAVNGFSASLTQIGGAPLFSGEVIANGIYSAVYNLSKTRFELTSIGYGSAANQSTSSQTGIVAAVKSGGGGITVGHMATFSDTFGTVTDGGPLGVANSLTYITAANAGSTTLGPGSYLTDTSGGAFTIYLPGTPVLGNWLWFEDGPGTWNINNFTINGNGYQILGNSSLVCNVLGEGFGLWFNGSSWERKYNPIGYSRFGGVISSATTLTAAQSGMIFEVDAASASFNITLPALFAGMRYKFFGIAASSYTVGLTFTGNLFLPDGTTQAAGTFTQLNLAYAGNSIEVWSDGANVFMQEIGGNPIIKSATAGNQAVPLSQVQANFAALAGLSTQVFNAAAATTATEVLPLGQVYRQLSIAANQSLTLTALETLVFSNGLTSNITITLEPGTIQGQKVRFMSGNPTTYLVTVNSNVSSGSPAFYFPDGTSTYSTGPTNSTPQGSLLCQWDGTNWHCQTTGLDSVMVCCEQQPSGTNGGSSVAGLQTRILNTVLWNTISGASLSSNEITLPAGTYDIRADLPASTTTGVDHRGYLYIPSTSTISLLGSSASTGGSVTVSEIEGMLNTAGVTFNIQHWISVAQATTGLGIASGMGQPEVYTQIFIRKVE